TKDTLATTVRTDSPGPDLGPGNPQGKQSVFTAGQRDLLPIPTDGSSEPNGRSALRVTLDSLVGETHVPIRDTKSCRRGRDVSPVRAGCGRAPGTGRPGWRGHRSGPAARAGAACPVPSRPGRRPAAAARSPAPGRSGGRPPPDAQPGPTRRPRGCRR